MYHLSLFYFLFADNISVDKYKCRSHVNEGRHQEIKELLTPQDEYEFSKEEVQEIINFPIYLVENQILNKFII
ncbi:MAG: hypothetical protein HeimC2_09020 [Candidatus Heimdallarchaeota archaeon LC_2]|nr:MAG: hypothetical protein HeimC2_09020 [Candidatus Heimdallarchaeota archaeon LC_2]